MKMVHKILTVAALFSSTVILAPTVSHAQFRDLPAVDCQTLPTNDGSRAEVHIQRGMGGGFQDASVMAWGSDGRSGHKVYQVTVQDSAGFQEVRYWGAGFSMVVDLGFDNVPRANYPYDATLSADFINSGSDIRVRCEFLGF